MICFYLIWCFGYFGALTWLARHWPSKSLDSHFPKAEFPRVSVIIPFRNESRLVSSLVLALKNIHSSVLEILLVDDQSEDDSFEKFVQGGEEIPNLQVLKSLGIGKKAALQTGILKAKGEVMLTTDADCTFTPGWVSEILGPFQDPKVQLVAGPVISEDSNASFFSRFQQLEWASILLLTHYSFKTGNPLMCSGANLSFRKTAFEQVNGYAGNEMFLSGDDEFLLKKIHQVFGPEACQYRPTLKALVHTEPQVSWSELLNQRVRWAGKWRLHRSFFHGLVTLLAFFVQLIWISTIFLFSVGQLSLLAFAGIWLGKMLAEGFAFRKVLKSLDLSFSWISLLATSLIHPFYVLGVGLGTIGGKFSWKGRSN
ncbi:MAG: glycosyltransferase [Cyclobacteriaceae bacterium]|nr:glycosyltransferase [Cyclobacteriaceae bacterium]